MASKYIDIEKAKAGDEISLRNLLEQYEPLINKCTQKMLPLVPRATFDDCKSDVTIEFLKILRNYNADSGNKFITYAMNSFQYVLGNTHRMHNRKKHKGSWLKASMDISGDFFSATEDTNALSGHQQLLDIAESSGYCIALNNTEIKILVLNAHGFEYREISDYLLVSVKRIAKIQKSLRHRIESTPIDP